MTGRENNRYNTSGMIEAEYEAGSSCVFKNLCGIKRKREIDKLEYENYIKIINKFIDLYIYEPGHNFTATDIRKIHNMWLGNIYSWAGQYRSVNMSKPNFTFAAANLIPSLMEKFEGDQLKKYTPCSFKNLEEIIEAIAVVHVELILIHPFREGNGRIARALSSLMALQAGLPSLDFGAIKGKKRKAYFAAVRAGLDDYRPMKDIFRSIIKRTLKIYHR